MAISLPIYSVEASKAIPKIAVSLYLSSDKHSCIRFWTFKTFPLPTYAALVMMISMNLRMGCSIICKASKVA